MYITRSILTQRREQGPLTAKSACPAESAWWLPELEDCWLLLGPRGCSAATQRIRTINNTTLGAKQVKLKYSDYKVTCTDILVKTSVCEASRYFFLLILCPFPKCWLRVQSPAAAMDFAAILQWQCFQASQPLMHKCVTSVAGESLHTCGSLYSSPLTNVIYLHSAKPSSAPLLVASEKKKLESNFADSVTQAVASSSDAYSQCILITQTYHQWSTARVQSSIFTCIPIFRWAVGDLFQVLQFIHLYF